MQNAKCIEARRVNKNLYLCDWNLCLAMNKYFKDRCSRRSFSNQEISEEKVRLMLQAAAKAPTTGNMQLYSVVLTRDQEKKRMLAPAHFSQPAFMNAPLILTFCADFNRFVKWCNLRNASPGYDNLQSIVAAVLDTVILAQQFVTVAEMEGFGTCYLGTTSYNPDKIAEVLELPERVLPIITVAMGYPEGEPVETDRLPLEAFLHSETYQKYSDKDIEKFYKEKENRADSKFFVAENAKENLAQVFTDVRYPKSNNEHFSRILADFVKKIWLDLDN